MHPEWGYCHYFQKEKTEKITPDRYYIKFSWFISYKKILSIWYVVIRITKGFINLYISEVLMLLIDSHIKDILLTKTKQNETTIKKRAIKTDAQQIRKKNTSTQSTGLFLWRWKIKINWATMENFMYRYSKLISIFPVFTRIKMNNSIRCCSQCSRWCCWSRTLYWCSSL